MQRLITRIAVLITVILWSLPLWAKKAEKAEKKEVAAEEVQSAFWENFHPWDTYWWWLAWFSATVILYMFWPSKNERLKPLPVRALGSLILGGVVASVPYNYLPRTYLMVISLALLVAALFLLVYKEFLTKQSFSGAALAGLPSFLFKDVGEAEQPAVPQGQQVLAHPGVPGQTQPQPGAVPYPYPPPYQQYPPQWPGQPVPLGYPQATPATTEQRIHCAHCQQATLGQSRCRSCGNPRRPRGSSKKSSKDL